jgi:hypothetical protein
MPIVKLGFEGGIPSLFYGDGTNQSPVSTPLLTTILETMAPSWAISNTPSNQTSAPTWEKLVVLDQT